MDFDWDIYRSVFIEKFGKKIQKNLVKFSKNNSLKNLDLNLDFSYIMESSAVYSANIEGNSLDLNSFINQKNIAEKFRTKDTQEILDLISAYNFARKKSLSEINFLEIHKLSSSTILAPFYMGKYRDQPVGIYGTRGLIYLAIESDKLLEEMKKFWEKIEVLLKKDLSHVEVFYYASMIHLRFAHIHPFMDGNGRSARLLEKWFLAEKLGKNIWKISSEKYYWDYRSDYYHNINLGVNFYELDYKKSDKFLAMLVDSVLY